MSKKTYPLILIAVILIAHFTPFERSSIAADDYVYLLSTQNLKLNQILGNTLKISDRPINYIFLILQGKLIGENTELALICLFLSVIFVIFGFYYLFLQLFDDPFTAFVGTLVFCLLPNTLEIYHSLIFLNMNTAIGIYIFSSGFFIKFVNSKRSIFLYLSFFSFLLVIFWYEVGFFMPFVLMAYCLCLGKKRELKRLLPFFIAEIVYLTFRFSIVPAFSGSISQHTASLAGFSLAISELFQHCAGRYLFRSIVYGFYLFFVLLPKWLFLILLILDACIVFILAKVFRNNQLKTIKNQFIFSIAASVIFITPLFFNKSGGIGGRHMVLPSIGIVMLVIWMLSKLRHYWRPLLLVSLVVFLVVSQGNSWAQVVSCRINRAIYNKIKQNKGKIEASDRVVFDNMSFADNINFTFIKRDFNLLNTYFGSQALEDRGLVSMVYLTVNGADKPVYIAKSHLFFTSEGKINFEISKDTGYRSITREPISLPQENTLIIGFKDVFGGVKNYGAANNEK